MRYNFILHAGLHKTGSSSIQETFAKLDMPDHHYLPLGTPNHSGRILSIFQDPDLQNYAEEMNGDDPATSEKRRAHRTTILLAAIGTCHKPNIIISAEGITMLKPDALLRLRQFLEPFARKISVLAYVRPPISAMASSYHQHVMMGARKYFLLPAYRARISPLDQVFGVKNVTLIKFDKDSLRDGDAVKDFAHRLGVDLPDSAIVRTNVSLSLKALCVLTAYRALSPQAHGFPGAIRLQKELVKLVSPMTGSKLKLAHSFAEPYLQEAESDLNWIEKRMGQTIRDQGSDDPDAIKSADELLKLAGSHTAELSGIVTTFLNSPRFSYHPAPQILRQRLSRIGPGAQSAAAAAEMCEIAVEGLLHILKIEGKLPQSAQATRSTTVPEWFDSQGSNVEGEGETDALSTPPPKIAPAQIARNVGKNLDKDATMPQDSTTDAPQRADLNADFSRFGTIPLAAFVKAGQQSNDLIFFHHIPKTAGSSLSQEMRFTFAPYMNIHVDRTADNPAPNTDAMRSRVTRFLETNGQTGFRSASGHLRFQHLRLLRESVPGLRAFTFLRDPVARFISEYRYSCTSAHPQHESFRTRYPTIEHYVDDPSAHNRMWHYVAPAKGTADAAGVTRALRGYLFIGTVEDLTLCFEFFSALFGHPKTPTKRVNETRPTSANEVAITDALKTRIREANGADQALFDAVQGRLAAQRDQMQTFINQRRAAYAGAQG